MTEKEHEKLNMEHEKDDEIILEPDKMHFYRAYDYLPYSYWRIVEILNDYLGMKLVRVRAYKEGRYPGYKNHYDIYDNETGKLVKKHVYLDGLRRLFAHWDIPLHENNRNKRAEYFLHVVNQIAKEQQRE